MSTAAIEFASLPDLFDLFLEELNIAASGFSNIRSMALQECPPLDRLVDLLGLTSFERNALLFCAGMELDPRFPAFVADRISPPGSSRGVSFSFLLATLPDAHWTSLSPDRPLRRWQLVDMPSGEPLLHAPLRLDPRILLYLLDVPGFDEELALIRPCHADPSAIDRWPASNSMVQGSLYWQHPLVNRQAFHPLLVIAREEETRLRMANRVAQMAGFRLAVLRSVDIPAQPVDRERLACRWTREAILAGWALYIQRPEDERPEERSNVESFLQSLIVPVAIGCAEDLSMTTLMGVRIHEAPATRKDQRMLWQQELGLVAHRMNGRLDAITAQFDLSTSQIMLAAALTRATAEVGDPACDLGEYAWQLVKEYAGMPLNKLAQRIQPHAGWDDLVLPSAQKELLQQIISNVRLRSRVYDDWGFSTASKRGLAVTALFSGSSGTGKTMAAEIVATTLDLDLFHVDLSSVVSKYIGETEKNLNRIFDAAEQSGAVLLFDEADSLFGKRTEISDARDRYANLEVSYLLQRMESYRGVAILTTNLRHHIDQAFHRRIRFFVDFPFPDAACRAAIWRRAFPEAAPVEQLNYERLAQLNIPGGLIRNIALQSAFFAAQEGQPIGMMHLLAAARCEYGKLDRSIAPAELRGWL